MGAAVLIECTLLLQAVYLQHLTGSWSSFDDCCPSLFKNTNVVPKESPTRIQNSFYKFHLWQFYVPVNASVRYVIFL